MYLVVVLAKRRPLVTAIIAFMLLQSYSASSNNRNFPRSTMNRSEQLMKSDASQKGKEDNEQEDLGINHRMLMGGGSHCSSHFSLLLSHFFLFLSDRWYNVVHRHFCFCMKWGRGQKVEGGESRYCRL